MQNAWQDIVENRLYITGSASAGEVFRDDHVLPNQVGAHICETCVTTTWIQLNLQLLRLTGEAKYGDELERSFYNHLAAAQHPSGGDWCYYTALEGKKPFDPGINCCHSSGPRGMALAAQAAYFAVKTARCRVSAGQYVRGFPGGTGAGRSAGVAHSEQSFSPRGRGNTDFPYGQAGIFWTSCGYEMGGAAVDLQLQAHGERPIRRFPRPCRITSRCCPGNGGTATA